MGEEPIIATGDNVASAQTLASAYTWYNYMCSKGESRDYIETYLKNAQMDKELKAFKSVPDSRIPLSPTPWIARMLTLGTKLPESTVSYMRKKIQEAIDYDPRNDFYASAEDTEAPVEKPKERKKVNVQEKIADKVSDFIGMVEELIDKEGYSVSVYNLLQENQIPPLLAKKVAVFYKPIADEAEELLKTKQLKKPDAQLVEGYNHLNNKQAKERAAFYATILADCERFSGNVKKQRAPRKKKVITADKKLKNFKFQKDDKNLKVVSVNAEKVLGAQELWTYNTKYHALTHLVALDRGGLNVQGTAFKNYNEEESKTYKVGSRKEASVIQEILTSGKRAINKLVSSLKVSPKVLDRSNENTLLLKFG